MRQKTTPVGHTLPYTLSSSSHGYPSTARKCYDPSPSRRTPWFGAPANITRTATSNCLRPAFCFPRGALERVVSFINGEQGSPSARKTKAISQGFTRIPQLNQDSPRISFIYIDANQGYAFTLVKGFKS